MTQLLIMDTMDKFEFEGYIIELMNVWEVNAKYRLICESNSSKYTRLLTEEELKEEPLWKPRLYNSTKAAKFAIRYYDGGDELVYKIIPVRLEYQIIGETMEHIR